MKLVRLVFAVSVLSIFGRVLQQAETPPEGIGTKIESPNGTFFVEELPAPTKNEAGETIDDQEVWIVSAKDSTARERLPDFMRTPALTSSTAPPFLRTKTGF